jgi:hypothetical protein
VQFRSGRESLYVAGEVKWVRAKQGLYCVGFALYDSGQTDIVAWKALIARRLD